MSAPPALLPSSSFTKLSLLSQFLAPARPPGAVDLPSAGTAPIVAFCHLPWDGVWQRPQQLLSRLAVRHPVLFVECYCAEVEHATLRSHGVPGYHNVTVLQMLLPAARWSDGDFIDAERRRLLQVFRRGDLGRFSAPVLWFNDPMAVVAFAGHSGERAIVYDCMDELAQFAGAPPQIQERERELLQSADVVFCGGRKMRDKRKPYNPHCYFYGTGVDTAHFGRARSDDLAIDPAIAALPGKVLGYFGVIDERIDYELLARLADALPRCSIAMVGPTAKIDAASLPQRKNLHWLGRRDYADLPAITKGFSVCLMPFARNAATEFINPTKALEYMATGRPIISTAIDEVRTNFGNVSRI
ncbi:MAG TPA: glycosyltransferase, partial [Acidobacteriota bacterium]|nr:glycosyltransferase [Acidobacteriota bacterium]